MDSLNLHSLQNAHVSMAWSLPFSFPFNPFNSRFTLSWRDNLMIAGVVLTVVSAVASFFSGLVIAGAAFTGAAGLLAFSGYYVYHFNDGIALQKTVGLLEQKNEELKSTQKKLESNAAELRRQYTEIQGINQTLNQTTASLQSRTQELQTANEGLSRNNQAIQANLQQLQQTNQNLQQRINALQQALPILKDQVAAFANQNISFGRNVNVLNLDVTRIDQQNRELSQSISGFDMTFDTNVLELSQAIQRAQTVSQTLFTSLGDQKIALEKDIETLNKTVSNIKILEQTMKQREKELQDLENKIATETGNLQKLQQAFTKTQLDLSNTKDAITQESQKLQKIQNDLSSDEHKLEQTKKDLQAIPGKLADAEKKLREEVEKIESKKKELVEKLDKKINDRISEAKTKKLEVENLDRQIQEKRKQLPGATS